jgi:PAS domain-containing protein
MSIARGARLRKQSIAKQDMDPRWMLALQTIDAAHEILRAMEHELHTQAAELTQVSEALEVEQRQYDDWFDDAPLPYFVTDCDGLVLAANRLICQLLNSDCHALVGRPLAMFCDTEDGAQMNAVLSVLSSIEEVTTLRLALRPYQAEHALSITASVRRGIGDSGAPSALRWIVHEQPRVGLNAVAGHA